MNYILLYLFVFIINTYFINCNENYETTEIPFDNVAKYNALESTRKQGYLGIIDSTQNSRLVERTIGLINKKTCSNLKKISNRNEALIVIKDSHNCRLDVEVENGRSYFVIHLNDTCNEQNKLQKLLFSVVDINIQLISYLRTQKSKSKKYDREINLLQITKKKYLMLTSTKKLIKVKINQLNFLNNYRNNKYANKIAKIFEQQEISNQLISFSDEKYLNTIMCSDYCKSTFFPRVKCENDGYIDSTTCNDCFCPFFFTGKKCENLMKSRKHYYCEEQVIYPQYYEQNKTLNLDAECFYKIQSKTGAKIQLELHFPNPIKYECRFSPLIEVLYQKDHTERGIIPCGIIYGFSVESEGNSIYIYNSRLGDGINYQLIYKLVWDYRNGYPPK